MGGIQDLPRKGISQMQEGPAVFFSCAQRWKSSGLSGEPVLAMALTNGSHGCVPFQVDISFWRSARPQESAMLAAFENAHHLEKSKSYTNSHSNFNLKNSGLSVIAR